MDSFIEDVKRRLAEDRKRLEKIISQRMALVSQEHVLGERIRAYEVLVRDEHNTTESQNLPSVEKPPSEGTSMATPSVVGFITKFISQRNGQGVTHKEIRDALLAANYKTHKNYQYVVVSNLKENGKVSEKKGKLVWVNAVEEKVAN
jgi:hypothetical protein